MGSAVGEIPLIQNADLVRADDGVKTVGDNDNGLALDHFGDSLVHLLLVFRIHECGRLVENDDGRIFQNRPCQRYALPFTAGELFASITGEGLRSLGQAVEKFHTLCLFSGLHDFFIRSVRSAEPYVFQKGGIEQELFLGNIGDLIVERFQTHFTDVLSAHFHRAPRYIVEVYEQFSQGRLAAAGLADKGGYAPFRYMQADAVDNLRSGDGLGAGCGRLGRGVGKTHVLKSTS